MRQGTIPKMKICIALLFLIAGTALLTGCKDHTYAAPPTLSNRTPNGAQQSGQPPEPTPTPDADAEIYFTDVNLESAVREELKKKIGPILRSDVESMKTLNAAVRAINSIDTFQYFTHLEELNLFGNRITDFSVLAKLPSLKRLNIGKNYNIINGGSSGKKGLDITPLKNLVLLEELDASDNAITDVSALGSLTSLRELRLQRNKIVDITPLSGCEALTYVDLSGNLSISSDNMQQGISDLSPLFGNVRLQTLIASNNIIEAVDGIERLRKLTALDLSYNLIKSAEPVAKLPALETVDLSANYLASIDAFYGNTTLRSFYVSYNMIAGFQVITSMPALEQLGWQGNPINPKENYDVVHAFDAQHPAQNTVS